MISQGAKRAAFEGEVFLKSAGDIDTNHNPVALFVASQVGILVKIICQISFTEHTIARQRCTLQCG